MSSVPAWKRLGLKVKSVVKNDPLAVAARGDDVVEKLSQQKKEKKQGKEEDKSSKEKVASKKRKAEDSGSEGKKKPPKRVKVPKSERPVNNVIKDQLHYMRQFSQDRESWKFSKQKQNWIIKNIRNIPEDYEEDMVAYLKSIQGGSRERVIREMENVVSTWNEQVKIAEEKLAQDLQENDVAQEENVSKDNSDSEKTSKKEKKNKKGDKSPQKLIVATVDYDYAVRARTIVQELAEKKLQLLGVDSVDEESLEKRPAKVNLVEEYVDVE